MLRLHSNPKWFLVVTITAVVLPIIIWLALQQLQIFDDSNLASYITVVSLLIATIQTVAAYFINFYLPSQNRELLSNFKEIHLKAIEMLKSVQNDTDSEFSIVASSPVFGIDLSEAERNIWNNLLSERISHGYTTKIICLDPSMKDTKPSVLQSFCVALASFYKKPQLAHEYEKIAFDGLLHFGQLIRPFENVEIKLREKDSPFHLILTKDGKNNYKGLLYISSTKTLQGNVKISGLVTTDESITQTLVQLFDWIWNYHRDLKSYTQFDQRTPEQVERDKMFLTAEKNKTYPYEKPVGGIMVKVHQDVFPPDVGYGIPLIMQAIESEFDNLLSETPREKIVGIDIGTGTGILALKLAQKCSKVYASDISESAVINARENFKEFQVNNPSKIFHCVRGDLFDTIPQLAEDEVPIIVFNHPYYPSPLNLYGTLVSTGGKEIIKRFLEQASKRVGEKGVILMPYSNIAGNHHPISFARDYKLRCEAAASQAITSNNSSDYVYVLKFEKIETRN